jgi:hypothetical protein
MHIPMTPNHLRSSHLDPKQVIENITLKKIMLQYPETITYKSLIKFTHIGNKASLDLALLPQELANKITAMFV